MSASSTRRKHSRSERLSHLARSGLLAVLLIAVFLTSACAETSTSTQYAEPEPTGSPVATAPASPAAAQPAPAPKPVPAPTPASAVKLTTVQVTRIVDGDTIWVRMPNGSTEKVRFIGVDTPESTNQIEPYGKEASAYTANALSGKTIYLETDAELRDRYGRMLAHIWLSPPAAITSASVRTKLFNARLLLDGYANLMTIPPNVKYVDYLKKYESEARNASLGLWAGTAPPTAPVAKATAPASQASGAYIANRNTRKFHHANCSSVDDMNESNKVPYSNRDQAVADGYVPCQRCNP